MLEDIDLLALYAHCDASEAESRASWRGFLSFVLALLLQTDAETSDELVSSSIVGTPEDLDQEGTLEPFVRQIHVLSAELSTALGMSTEFGLAALLDYNPPTRTYAVHRSKETSDDLVRLWLSRFQLLQGDSGFQNILGHWREGLARSLNSESAEEALLAMELGTNEAAASPETPEQEEEVQPTRRSRRRKSA